MLTDEEQLGYCAEDIMKMLADHVHDCKTPLRTKLCMLIRPYMAKAPVRESVEVDRESIIYLMLDAANDGAKARERASIIGRWQLEDALDALLQKYKLTKIEDVEP